MRVFKRWCETCQAYRLTDELSHDCDVCGAWLGVSDEEEGR